MITEAMSQKSEMQQFYEGKVVLLTGGTGFLGKILIEKLVRSCPNIRQLYLLVREKRGSTAEERLQRLLDSAVFSRLRCERPGWAARLAVVTGDLAESGLGLDPASEELLTQTVDVVIHLAATVRFDEKLSNAVATNVTATKRLCLLAQRMVQLKAFVYVSTAYSNCDQPLTKEKVCPSSICPEKLISLSELLEDSVLDNLTPSLLGSKPNTYVFTKCAAEQIIYKFKSSLPVAIIRPSIVGATVSEPVAGWIDSYLGSTGGVLSVQSGLLRSMLCDRNAVMNLVPADSTVNAVLALAYSVAAHHRVFSPDEESVPVVNFVSTKANSVTWLQGCRLVEAGARQYPSLSLPWYPFLTVHEHPWLHSLHCALLHHLPATLIDFLSAKCGSPTRFKKLYRQMDTYFKVMHYFYTRNFEFEERNAKLLWDSLEPQDQELFPFNMADICWESYSSHYAQGCRQYLLKEDPSTLKKARRRVKVLYVVHLMTKSALILLVAAVPWFIYSSL